MSEHFEVKRVCCVGVTDNDAPNCGTCSRCGHNCKYHDAIDLNCICGCKEWTYTYKDQTEEVELLCECEQCKPVVLPLPPRSLKRISHLVTWP